MIILSQSFSGEGGQYECCLMDILVVVLAQFLFLFWGPASYGLLDVSLCVFATDHEADLS